VSEPFQSRDSSRGGSSFRPRAQLRGMRKDSASVSGRGKAEYLTAARLGSSPLVKYVTDPLDSKRNGNGRLCAGRLSGRPAAYFADCASTPVNVPSAFASTAPNALRSR